MTYVSRRTRIIVSSWLDECDVEQRLRACRRRSDGRLKKYNSCDDCRAWINDNCIKYEYLSELMSNGESTVQQPFRLYGRFIPVPVLFQLTQNSKTVEGEESIERQDVNARRSKSATSGKSSDSRVNGDFDSGFETGKVTKSTSLSGEFSRAQSNSSLIRVQWEKNILEKSLLECTCLLNKAIKKLEKIDGIVALAHKESEQARGEEIQEAFYKSKFSCSCSALGGSNNGVFTTSYEQRLKESAKCTELLRKISALWGKLKQNKEYYREVNQQIMSSQRRSECSSPPQVTELYRRRDQDHLKKLQKKMHKLTTERGKLLSEMCHALTCLNNFRRSSKPKVNFRSGDSLRKNRDSRCQKFKESSTCSCDSPESSDTLKCHYTESPSSDSDDSDNDKDDRRMKQIQGENGFSRDRQTACDEFGNYGSRNSERYFGGIGTESSECRNLLKGNSNKFSTLTYRKETQQLISPEETKEKNTKEKKQEGNAGRKSKVKFVCPESPCKKKLDADDISAFENSLSPQQESYIFGVLKNLQDARPRTSPTTKREIHEASFERDTDDRNITSNVLERRAKSETTMKEIEKSLRNYQRRLSNLETLEGKVEDLKDKLSDTNRLRRNLTRVKAEAEQQREADKEKSEREITKLCMENWELKKQVQQLAAKFNAQTMKIQNLKCDAMRARELECQAEELKKELSEYRDGFEHQRKCISKWETEVAVQRTEIENLMNHIRMLTTVKEGTDTQYQDNRSSQSTRPYSPDMTQGRAMRPKTQSRTFRAEFDEGDNCCCEEHDSRRVGQVRSLNGPYGSRRTEWCN